MKYDKKEPETMDADPMRLLVSAILAFTVMLFINGFVGSMGGFPAFVAFTLVFFRIRTRAGMENGGMQQELSDRQITGRLLWKYAAGYLVLWGILRIAFLISRVTGWGNINGASAVEYVRQMWNTSLLEKWAYFFAGMIMFAFVLSLFPLAVIREKVRWIRYALVDGAVFALVCIGMNGVCRLKFEQKSSGRATCLIDHLLLCGRMRTWQEITCLLAMVVFILVIGAFVFNYASRQYAVKNIDGIPASAGEEESRRHRMIRKIVTVGCSIAAAAIVVVIVLLMPKDTAGDYTKVAEFLTEYNLDSLTVGTTEDPTVSRMTIATVSDDETFEQIKKQLNRLVEVIKVIDFTDVFVRMKEILYVKVRKCSKDDKVEFFQIAVTFKAKIIDDGKDSVLLEFVQTATKNDAVIKLMKEEFASIEVVRGGSVGIESISMMER